MANWIILLLVGRLMVYLWQKMYLPDFLNKIKFIKYLHECDLCSGVWIYGGLSYFYGFDLLRDVGLIHVPIISELVTGGILSFLVQLFILGWKAKFEVIEL